jgi:poly(beta-D-mannuronate) lyase
VLICAILLVTGTGLGTDPSRAAEVTAADPASLAQAIKQARPGDTIVMADGPWRDARIVFEAQGEPGRPITLRAATPGKVVLCGASRLLLAGSDLVVSGLLFTDGAVESGSVIEFRRNSTTHASRCRLTECAIVDYSPPDIKADTKWVSLYGQSNRVDHCYFAGKTNNGTTLVVWVADQPDQHTIDFNHFGPRPRLGFNGGETIRVGTSEVSMNVSRTLVENNLFEKCDGEIEAISNKSCENVYRNNTFLSCAATLCLRHGNRCLVEGNFFVGNRAPGSGGVRIIGEGHRVVNNYFTGLEGDESRSAIALECGLPKSPLNGYFQVKDAVIAHNTVVGNKWSLAIGVRESKKNTLPPVDCTFAHNIVVGAKGSLVHQITPPERLKWEDNVFWGAELGIETPPGVTLADPHLAQGSDGLWKPAAGSSSQGAALGDRRPLSAQDVGPSWRRGASR